MKRFDLLFLYRPVSYQLRNAITAHIFVYCLGFSEKLFVSNECEGDMRPAVEQYKGCCNWGWGNILKEAKEPLSLRYDLFNLTKIILFIKMLWISHIIGN